MTRQRNPHGNSGQVSILAGSGVVSLPRDIELATAQFERDGLDLVVVPKSGPRILIKGYFAVATPPDLAVSGGPVVAGDAVAAMADGDGPFWGRLHSFQGSVEIVDMDGNAAEATPGRPLLPGESVVTGPAGAAAVMTPDGATVAVGTNSQLGGIAAPDADGGTIFTLRLETGEFTVLAPLGGEVHLVTPAGAVSVNAAQAGVVVDDGLSVILMHGGRHRGTATVSNEFGSVTLAAPHEQVRLPADGPPGTMTITTDTDIIVRHSNSLMQLPLDEADAEDYGVQFSTAAGAEEDAAPNLAPKPPMPETMAVLSALEPVEAASIVSTETPTPAETERHDLAADLGVPPPDYPPIAFPDAVTLDEDQPYSGQLVATDPEQGPLAFALADSGGPTNGVVAIAPDGSYTYTPNPDYAGPDSFTYQVTDSAGAITTETVTISVAPVADVPVIETADVSTPEDVAVGLQIAAHVPGTESLSEVILSGIPTGASLNFGTDNGDGTWTLSGADLDRLDQLVLTPPYHSAADFEIELTAVSTDGGVAVSFFTVGLEAVADQPGLAVTDVEVPGTGGEPGSQDITGTTAAETLIGGGGDDEIDGRGGGDVIYGDQPPREAPFTVPLDVASALADIDGSEQLRIEISGIPDGGLLSAGTDLGGGTWSLGADELSGLSLQLPVDHTDDLSLLVSAIATDTDPDSGAVDNAVTTAPLDIVFTGGPDGADVIDGGGGDDLIFGGGGDDDIEGGSGADEIYGDDGNDVIDGQGGSDLIYGGSGDDTIDGGLNPDIIYGGAGDDDISGSGGEDLIHGDAGDDVIDGGSQADEIYGDAGADTLIGGTGDDTLFGGDGDDVLIGDDGNDLLSGGGGSNAFVFDQRSGSDFVTDFQVGDVLRFEGDRFSADQLNIETVDNDTIITFGNLHNVEVTLADVDLPGDGYTITQDPDALIITYSEKHE